MHLKMVRMTIKEVAAEAGVSTQTVSRVINERPDVSPKPANVSRTSSTAPTTAPAPWRAA
jgi:plasmid maintenance system antidote protein VapI